MRSALLIMLVASLALSMIGTAAFAQPAAGDDGSGSQDPGVMQDEEYEVLFFHLTTGFRHDSIEYAIEQVEEIGTENGFSVDETQDPEVFNDEDLAAYETVVFFTDGEDTLNPAQRTAFERYIQRGGGFVGLHSTSNMDNQGWPWWEDLMAGAFFVNHPDIQDGLLEIEDDEHPSTSHFEDATFEWPDDEWYNFTANPRDNGAHVLLTVDPDSFEGGEMGDDHPISWCNSFDGGRTFYTAIGHSEFHYDIPEFRDHILGGIEWTAGMVDGDCGEERTASPTDASFDKVTLEDDVENPMMMDIAPDGRVFFTEIAGSLRIHDPETGNTTTAAEIDVYRDHENGLLGVVLDPDFEENGWIYLFYSNPDELVQHVSRFDFDETSQTLDTDSEELLLEIPHQRDECCHSSGDLEFDSQGNLYISTGDDTNPFGSDNYAPIDYRDERGPWDAARTSGDTSDLRGKVLRITPMDEPGDTPGEGSTYTVPDDNLFTSGEHDDLFEGGTYDPDIALPEIYVMGLRNPFKISVDPVTDWLYIGDVGPDSNPSGGFNEERGPWGYDSWTQVRDATNKGWPFCYQYDDPYRDWDFETEQPGDFFDCEEGAINESPRNDGLTQLPPATSRTIWYPYCLGDGSFNAEPDHDIPCGPVEDGQNFGTGRAAYMGEVYNHDPEVEEESAFPEYYDGKPFVIEWERDIIATMDLDEDGEYIHDSFTEFMPRHRYDDDQRFRKPHDLSFGPDGRMYVLEWGDDFNFAAGSVNEDAGLYRIDYVRDGRTPIAQASADPDSGQPDLEVQFSSEGSTDPDGGELTYLWDFDDDGATSTDADPTHTYTEPGVYDVQLTVIDDGEREGVDTVTVTVGNTRPEVSIDTPADGQVVEWGEEISYSVSVEDAEDGSTEDGGIDCDDVIVETGLRHQAAGGASTETWTEGTGCEGSFVPEIGDEYSEEDDLTGFVTASYTDGGGDVGEPLTGEATYTLQPSRKQAQFFTDSEDIDSAPSGDTQCCGDAIGGSGGAWASYDPFNLDGIDQMTLRAAALDDTTVEVRAGAPDGDLLATADVAASTEIARVDGPEGFGSAVQLGGDTPHEYVEMPEGVVSDLDDFTIATWVDWDGGQSNWARVWDLGTSEDNYMFLSPNAGAGNAGLRYAITTGGPGGEQTIDIADDLPADGWNHVAVTLEGETGTLWLNGEAVATNDSMSLSPSDLGETDQNWIGQSQWGADPLFDGAVDEFQIYDSALDQDGIEALLSAPDGEPVGGNVASYDFEGDGAQVLDGSGNDAHATIQVADVAAAFEHVTVDVDAGADSFPLYLVFPDSEARVNYLDFGDPADLPDEPEPDPELPPCVSVDVDEFEGEELDDRWMVIEEEPDELSVADGRLSIQTVEGRDFFAGGGTLPNVVVQELPDEGAWTATTQMEWDPAQNFQNAGMVVYDDEDNYLKAGVVHADGKRVELIKEIGGAPEFLGDQGVEDLPADVWLRLESDGDEVVASYSTDGDAWTEFGTADLEGLEDAGVGMYATNSTDGAATEPPVAHFESFTLESEHGAEDRSVSDDFEGDELDGCRWDRTVRYDSGLLDVSDGWLWLTTTPDDIYDGNNTDPPNFVLQDAPEGDWTIETRVDAQLERNFQNMGFMLHEDDDNYLKGGIVATNDPGEDRQLEFELGTEVGGEAQQPFAGGEVPDSDQDDWWLRLTKQDDDYTLSWSADGEEFTAVDESRSIELDDPAIGLYAVGTPSQEEPVTVGFEYFELLDEVIDPDPEAPSVEASLDPADPDGEEGWYVSPVTVTLSSDDERATLEWRLAGDEEWIEWTDPVTIDEDDVYDLEYRATLGDEDADDGNGNGAPDQAEVQLVGFDFVPDELTVAQGATIVYDQVSGPAHNVVTTDADGNEIDSNGPASTEWDTYEFVAEDAGQFWVYCEPHATVNADDPAEWSGMVMELEVTEADDDDGYDGPFVSSEIGEVGFQLDQTPPETTASVDGTTEGDAFVDEATVTLDADDNLSGVAETHIREDGDEEFDVYDDPVTYTGEGSYTVEFRSADVAGNVEDWQSVSFEIVDDDTDPDAPTAEASLDPADPDGEDGWYVSPVSISLSSDDDDATLEWRLVGAEDWTTWTEPVEVSDDGIYELEYRATNEAGSSELGTVGFQVDQTPPQTTASVDGTAEGGAFVDEASVTLDADDDLSGVAETHIREDGDEGFDVYDSPVTYTGEGSYTVEFRSADVAGNVEDWQSVSFDIVDDTDIVDPPPSEVCARHQGGATFPDAPGSGHRFFIDCLAELGIVEGYDDGTFGPRDDVSRGQLASFVVRALELATGETMETGGQLFPDVGVHSTHGQAIYKLRNAGVIRGYEDGTFRPRGSVTRDQTARYVVNALELLIGEELETSGAAFPDVAAGSQYAVDVDKLVTAGVISGFEDGTFGPREPVTRAQMTRFIGNALEVAAQEGAYQGP